MILLLLSIFFSLWKCSSLPTAPLSGGFEFKYDFSGLKDPAIYPRAEMVEKEGINSLMCKTNSTQLYNLARVMVVDLSLYDSWTEFTQSADWQEYVTARTQWVTYGNTNSWAEWKGFIGDFFTILTDQTLTMNADSARGVVTGAIGYNRIIVSMTQGDVIEYWGEGDAYGEKDRTTNVTITF
jgi:hypothetical protein